LGLGGLLWKPGLWFLSSLIPGISGHWGYSNQLLGSPKAWLISKFGPGGHWGLQQRVPFGPGLVFIPWGWFGVASLKVTSWGLKLGSLPGFLLNFLGNLPGTLLVGFQAFFGYPGFGATFGNLVFGAFPFGLQKREAL